MNRQPDHVGIKIRKDLAAMLDEIGSYLGISSRPEIIRFMATMFRRERQYVAWKAEEKRHELG